MTVRDATREADFAILRATTGWSPDQKERLAALPRRNPAGSAVLWEAYGSFLAEVGLPDNAVYRGALSYYARNQRR